MLSERFHQWTHTTLANSSPSRAERLAGQDSEPLGETVKSKALFGVSSTIVHVVRLCCKCIVDRRQMYQLKTLTCKMKGKQRSMQRTSLN